MSIWQVLAQWGFLAGSVAFGGGLLSFLLLFLWADRRPSPSCANFIDEAFRSTSLAMSIGFTLFLFSDILRYYLRFNGFVLPLQVPLEMARLLTVFALWVAWGWLEVIVMHRFRLEAPSGDVEAGAGYARARKDTRLFLKVLTGLFFLQLLLEAGRAG
jgi:hypothetical protein